MALLICESRSLKKVNDLYAVSANMDSEITITSGATEALFVAIHTLIGSGDEVIVFDPAFDSYESRNKTRRW